MISGSSPERCVRDDDADYLEQPDILLFLTHGSRSQIETPPVGTSVNPDRYIDEPKEKGRSAMNAVAQSGDWQQLSAEGLAGLSLDRLPAAELLLLDGLAACLMGPDAPRSPYTIEHGTVIVGHLLRALVDCSRVELEGSPPCTAEMSEARAAIVEGAHLFANRGVPGVKQLVNRFLAAAVGELEIHKESAEAQTRSLFYYGLLAVASGPNNRLAQEAADGILDVFKAWDGQFGDGFVPPWRLVPTAAASTAISHVDS